MSTNLFIVESPLQALSAFEAREQLGLENNILLVMLSSAKKGNSNTRMAATVEATGWKNVTYFKKYRNFKDITRLKLLLETKMISRDGIDKLFIGDVGYEFYLARCIAQPEDTFLLDDGAAVMTAQNEYFKSGSHRPNYAAGLRGLPRKLVYALFEDRTTRAKALNLFTAFNIENVRPEQNVIKNDYSTLRRMIRTRPLDDGTVYYFGGKNSETNIMNADNEIRFLRQVVAFYKQKSISFIYVPHRMESNRKLRLLQEQLGITVRDLNMPAELALATMEYVPAHIASAFSSILNNIVRIRDFKTVMAFRIPNGYLDARHDFINGLYDYYESIGINVVPISEDSN